MRVVKTIGEMRSIIAQQKKAGKTIGFVPTMGYLHEGHGSLVERARKTCDFVVVSIFVNPLQFGPNEDYERYPRDLNRDMAFLEPYQVDVVFHPSVEEMYPSYPSLTRVTVSRLTDRLCGASRPGHFDGVATVVAKLFNIVQPDYAFFGLKDAQQVAVIQQMVNDLNIPVQVVPCPTVREADGLAKSSRNVYLNEEERKQATILYQSLQMAKEQIARGEDDPNRLRERIVQMIQTQPLADIDYVEILSYPQLQPVESISRQPVIIALAVRFGKARLIDNLILTGGDSACSGP